MSKGELPGAVTADPTDEMLIAAVQHGDEAAFAVIVDRYKDLLMNFAVRYLGDYDEAEDVVQETFVRVYFKSNSYTPVAKFSTWIYTITGNLAKSRLRQKKIGRVLSLFRKNSSDDETEGEIPDRAILPDQETERLLENDLIQRALDELPAAHREVIVLCDIEERTYEEVCAITGLNMGTVKSRLNRGRTALKGKLADIRT
jgi:RNA polymerase sigma-70 factor (ECF subfamily)